MNMIKINDNMCVYSDLAASMLFFIGIYDANVKNKDSQLFNPNIFGFVLPLCISQRGRRSC